MNVFQENKIVTYISEINNSIKIIARMYTKTVELYKESNDRLIKLLIEQSAEIKALKNK